jgi:hypothetical protein
MAFSVKAEHQQEILKYMRYFNMKKEEFLKERQRDLKEFLGDALSEGDSIFNKEDVSRILEISTKKISLGGISFSEISG